MNSKIAELRFISSSDNRSFLRKPWLRLCKRRFSASHQMPERLNLSASAGISSKLIAVFNHSFTYLASYFGPMLLAIHPVRRSDVACNKPGQVSSEKRKDNAPRIRVAGNRQDPGMTHDTFQIIIKLSPLQLAPNVAPSRHS